MSNDLSLCCKKLSSSGTSISPFNKMIIFDWYDGPTSGVMLCDFCSLTYHFIMVDWDHDHDIRLFSLSRLTDESSNKLLTRFADTPEWPAWMPAILRSPNSEDHEFFDSNIKPIIEGAGNPEFIVAWSSSEKRGIVARRLDVPLIQVVRNWFEVDDLNDVYDWFSYLNLTKK